MTLLRVAATWDEVLDEPVGRCFADTCSLHFCVDLELWGCVLWGRPGGADLERMFACIDTQIARYPVKHASFLDVRRLEGFEARAFAVLARYIASRSRQFRSLVTRLAILRSGGWVGAMSEGIATMLGGLPFDMRTFTQPGPALAWLGRDAALADELDAQVEKTADTVLGRLRAHLEREKTLPSIGDAAIAVGLTPRSLQRALRGSGTTFRAECDRARIRLAQEMLSKGDAPVTQIAFEVGCKSSQHFSVLFRRVTGMSPSDWREKHR